MALAFQGRIDEAIAEGKLAAGLDPLSPQIPIDSSMALMFQGNYQAAKEQARRAAELDPTFFFAPMVDGAGRQQLDGDLTIEPGISSAIHHAHAALA